MQTFVCPPLCLFSDREPDGCVSVEEGTMSVRKKGDHVFNHFAKTIENAKERAIKKAQRECSKISKAIFNDSYKKHIGNVDTNPVLKKARTLTASSSGLLIDDNSTAYGTASAKFTSAIEKMVHAIASKSGNPESHKGNALKAWKEMTAAGTDDSAYKRLLKAKTGKELKEIETTYASMKKLIQHDFPRLGKDIVQCIADDVRSFVDTQ